MHAGQSRRFKLLWCNEQAQESQRDCCGLLSSEVKQGNNLLVAPVGVPLDTYIHALRDSQISSVEEPLIEWRKKNEKLRGKCFSKVPGELLIARLFSDLVRYINCCHKSEISSLDASADNFIIVCRRPELETKCYRFMLQAIDFEEQSTIPYNTVLPYAPNPSDTLGQLIMLRSMRVTKSFGKIGWQTGRAPAFTMTGRHVHFRNRGEMPDKRDFGPSDLADLVGDSYFDPLLDDRCHVAKNILLLLDAAHRLGKYTSAPWRSVRELSKMLIRIAQGKDVFRYFGESFLFNLECRLNSPEATETFIKESRDGEKIWWYLCKAVAILLYHETQESQHADGCNDYFSMLTHEDNDSELLKTHQAINTRWRVGTGIAAAAGAGWLLKTKINKGNYLGLSKQTSSAKPEMTHYKTHNSNIEAKKGSKLK